MRTRGRIDQNQPEIVRILREHGVSVWITSGVGHGAPDIVCGHRKQNFAFEIKDPAQKPSARLLTPDEMRWHNEWAGHVTTVTTAEEALRAIGIARK